jgi:NAD(P)H dehydrogenase (quinone)
MILITGANGHLGAAVISMLLKAGEKNIAGLVRSEEKGATLRSQGLSARIGDYTGYRSLLSAFKGVEKLVLISSSTIENRIQQHQNAIDAAKENKVKHIFYTSHLLADKRLSILAPDHHETEKLLIASGIPYTILRNTYYADFLPFFVGNPLETGVITFPSKGRKMNFALRSEIAEGLANAVLTSDAHRNKVYEITSISGYTFPEIAKAYSAGGREIVYEDITAEDFKQRLLDEGVPQELAVVNAGIGESFSRGALDYTDYALQNLLGRKPLDLKVFIQQMIKERK